MKFFKFNIFTFIFLSLFSFVIIWNITHFILCPSFERLQFNKNQKNVENFISKMDTNIQNIKNIINDYSKWDDTYEFMQNQNQDYIYDNFREGTSTLEDLDVDFVIYSNLDKKVVFSNYANDFLKTTKKFEKDILDYLSSFNDFYSMHIYSKTPLYLIKSEILMSDESGEVNGYIIAGKFITNERLEELSNNLFLKSSLVYQENKTKSSLELNLGSLTKVKVSTHLEDIMINNIEFLNNKEYVFSIDTTSEIDIVNQGNQTIAFFNFIITLFIVIVFSLLYRNQKSIENYNKELENKVNERTEELKKTIKELESSNNKQKEQEQLLIQQSRLASMGEMISNIAHQWRQPLNAVGLVIQNIQLAHEFNEIDDDFMKKSVNKVNFLTSNMSKTIDDFSNFFKPNKEKESFVLNTLVRKTLEMTESTLKHHEIEVKLNLDSTFEVVGFKNEFSQTLLNIINNAKDALLENEFNNPKIEIDILKDDSYGIINIKDNAGGVPQEIIEKIFDPYFTTKEEGKGTGIGLYMSKIIIEKNMSGSLLVKNDKEGAIFTVKIPLFKESK